MTSSGKNGLLKKIVVYNSKSIQVLEKLIQENLIEKYNIIPLRIGDESNVSDEVRTYQFDHFVEEERKRIKKHLEKIKKRSGAQQTLYEIIADESKSKDTIEQMALEAANLICGTTIGVLQYPFIKNSRSIHPKFDYMILDEASKTTFQEFLVPALYCKRWILSGDVHQLSPFVEQENIKANLSIIMDDIEKQICVDVFSVSSAISKSRRVPGLVIPLDDMDESILDYYGSQVKEIQHLEEMGLKYKFPREGRGISTYNISKKIKKIKEKILMQGSDFIFGFKKDIDYHQRLIPHGYVIRGDFGSPLLFRRRAFFNKRKNRDPETKSWEDQISYRLDRLHQLKDVPGKRKKMEFEVNCLLPYFTYIWCCTLQDSKVGYRPI